MSKPYNVLEAAQDLQVKNPFADNALAYLDLGYSPIPIIPKEKRPPMKWSSFSSEPPQSPHVELWVERYPDHDIGFLTGYQSGLFVLDVDSKKDDGFESLEVLVNKGLNTSGAAMVETQSGGLHYYFHLLQPGVRSLTSVMPGIDVRADGGLVVAPPSVGEGGVYRYLTQLPLVTQLPPVPDLLISLIGEHRGSARSSSPTGGQEEDAPCAHPDEEVDDVGVESQDETDFILAWALAGLKVRPGEGNYRCPGHRDSVSSLTINTKKRLWHYFSCDRRGNEHNIQSVLNGEKGGQDVPDSPPPPTP